MYYLLLMDYFFILTYLCFKYNLIMVFNFEMDFILFKMISITKCDHQFQILGH